MTYIYERRCDRCGAIWTGYQFGPHPKELEIYATFYGNRKRDDSDTRYYWEEKEDQYICKECSPDIIGILKWLKVERFAEEIEKLKEK